MAANKPTYSGIWPPSSAREASFFARSASCTKNEAISVTHESCLADCEAFGVASEAFRVASEAPWPGSKQAVRGSKQAVRGSKQATRIPSVRCARVHPGEDRCLTDPRRFPPFSPRNPAWYDPLMASFPLRINALFLTAMLACSTSSGGSSDASTTTANGNGGPPATGSGSDSAANAGGANSAENSGNTGNTGGNQGATNSATNGDAASSLDAMTPGAITCDPGLLRCKIAETPCPEGEVHSIVDACYGPCVKITACLCDAPAACPHDESYTCWKNTGHCNYYGP